jgi:hypothetical protein
LTVGLFAAVFAFALSVPAYAQTCDQETKTPVYQKYLDNYAGSIDQRQMAVDAAKEYIKLCAGSEIDKEIVDYLKGAIPALEEGIKTEKEQIAKQKLADAETERFNRFSKAFAAKNYDELFAAADDYLKYPPVVRNNYLDMRILMAATGGDLAASNPPIKKYDDLTLKYAQDAISRINAGEESGSKKWGGYNTKENTLGWLNYAIGYIKFYDQDKKDEAIAYYYKATQSDSGTKTHWPLYATIGSWYKSKMAALGKERTALDITEAAGENQKANIDKALSILAMEKGYAERAIDAYARAYSIAKSKSEVAAGAKTSLFDNLKQLFDFRYSSEQDIDKRSEANINSYVAGISSNSLPNPSSAVQPVIEKIQTEEPADKATDGTEGATSGQVNGGERSRTVGSTAKKTGNF